MLQHLPIEQPKCLPTMHSLFRGYFRSAFEGRPGERFQFVFARFASDLFNASTHTCSKVPCAHGTLRAVVGLKVHIQTAINHLVAEAFQHVYGVFKTLLNFRINRLFAGCLAGIGDLEFPGALLNFLHVRAFFGWRRIGRSRLRISGRIKHGGTVPHGSRDHMVDTETDCPIKIVWAVWVSVPCDLHSDKAAAGSGNPNGTEAITRMCQRDDPSPNGCGRATRRATRNMIQIPRVPARPEQTGLRCSCDAIFRRVGFPDKDNA